MCRSMLKIRVRIFGVMKCIATTVQFGSFGIIAEVHCCIASCGDWPLFKVIVMFMTCFPSFSWSSCSPFLFLIRSPMRNKNSIHLEQQDVVFICIQVTIRESRVAMLTNIFRQEIGYHDNPASCQTWCASVSQHAYKLCCESCEAKFLYQDSTRHSTYFLKT